MRLVWDRMAALLRTEYGVESGGDAVARSATIPAGTPT
jgi:hypothetical protein